MKKEKTDLVEQARQLRMQVEKLEKDVQHARGTQRVKRPTENVLVRPAHGPYHVGDDGPTEQLMAAIQRMLTDRPCRFQEILEATGARDNRIKGVINRLQREGVRIVDVSPPGTGRAALWFIPSDEVLDRIKRAQRNAARK